MRRALLTGPGWGKIYALLSGTGLHKSPPASSPVPLLPARPAGAAPWGLAPRRLAQGARGPSLSTSAKDGTPGWQPSWRVSASHRPGGAVALGAAWPLGAGGILGLIWGHGAGSGIRARPCGAAVPRHPGQAVSPWHGGGCHPGRWRWLRRCQGMGTRRCRAPQCHGGWHRGGPMLRRRGADPGSTAPLLGETPQAVPGGAGGGQPACPGGSARLRDRCRGGGEAAGGPGVAQGASRCRARAGLAVRAGQRGLVGIRGLRPPPPPCRRGCFHRAAGWRRMGNPGPANYGLAGVSRARPHL